MHPVFLQIREHSIRNAETLTLVFGDNVMDKTQTSGCFFVFELAENSVYVCEQSVVLCT